MNIDERLDRLTARHEALTESVEMRQATIEQDRAEHRRLTQRMGELTQRMGEVTGIARLLHVVEIHEPRIERLEGHSAVRHSMYDRRVLAPRQTNELTG